MTETTTPYLDLLRNPLWQKKRLDIMNRDNWTCAECKSGLNDAKTLHVHHIKYVFGRDPWDYPDANFETLCEDCHADRHDKKKVQAEPLIGTSEEDDSMNAAFAILYADLKKEISRLTKDDVDVLQQVTFITQYENVQVEYFLILESINDAYTAALYRKAVKWAIRLKRKEPKITDFTYTRYFDMRTTLLKRVLEQVVQDNLTRLKDCNGNINAEVQIQKDIQKLTRLKYKFLQSIKTV